MAVTMWLINFLIVYVFSPIHIKALYIVHVIDSEIDLCYFGSKL